MEDPIDGPSTRRAAMGRVVNEALAKYRRVGKFEADGLDAYYLYEFATADECAELIAMIDASCRPSTVISPEGPYSEQRTSHSGDLDRDDPLIRDLDDRLCTMMGLHPRQGETWQGQRYHPGQEFRAHGDYFIAKAGMYPEDTRKGGQRTWTAMIYLNTPEAGGTTWFTEAGFAVPPIPGLLIMWNNMAADGSPNPRSTHAGTPVEQGVKYVVTKWFREGYWA